MIRARVFDMAIESGLRNCADKTWAGSEEQIMAFARLCSANALEVIADQIDAQVRLADMSDHLSKAYWLSVVANELRMATVSLVGEKKEPFQWDESPR